MTSLFPLPLWVPALKRVPIPLQLLDEACARGKCSSRTRPGSGLTLDPQPSSNSFVEVFKSAHVFKV